MTQTVFTTLFPRRSVRLSACLAAAMVLWACALGGGAERAAASSAGATPLRSASRIQLAGWLGAHSRAWRVRYRSRSVTGAPIVESGLLIVPARSAPRGGFPVIAWAHGTVGVADRCAPSRTRDVGGYADFVARLVRAGYAVAAPDYEGLGTPGPHPYLVGDSEGRSVIDMVRAARAVGPTLTKRWTAVGHSQGGQAALFAGQLAARGAERRRLAGVVALAPASLLQALPLAAPGSPEQGYYALALAGLRAVDPELDLRGLLGERALALWPMLHRTCLAGVLRAFAALPASELTAGDAAARARVELLLARSDPGGSPIHAPVLLQQGATDATVPGAITGRLVDRLRGHGAQTTLRVYPRADHDGVLTAGLPDLIRWLGRHASGERLSRSQRSPGLR